jgi:UDP-N-acetylmuramoylalanine--D-glutamate ligase
MKKKIVVCGFGKTGQALLDFLLVNVEDAQMFLFNDTEIKGKENTTLKEHYETQGVTFLLGDHCFKQLEKMDLVLLSPGIDGRSERFNRIRKMNIKIISEIEFAFSTINVPIIAVTGTNGKSTTATLIHHMLTHNGKKSFLTGNIGTPLISRIKDITKDSVVVMEVSSFQLEEIDKFKPHVALILNITTDHISRHRNFENYVLAKFKIGINQKPEDFIILNYDDPLLRERGNQIGKAQRLWFSRCSKDIQQGVYAKNQSLTMNLNDRYETISLSNSQLRGLHNIENLMAAILAARLMGIRPEKIEASIKYFKGLPHRMESVGTIGSVEFINDSKATNVDATLKSINSLNHDVVLILGGKDKGGDFSLLGDSIKKRVKRVLLLGEAGPVIYQQLSNLQDRCTFVSDLSEATSKGYNLLEKQGGVLLLAPGCASFDMFNSFEQRGEVFKKEVLKLRRKQG